MIMGRRNKSYYFMTSTTFKRIMSIEGKPPTCDCCGKILEPNNKQRILSKLRQSTSWRTAHSRRYCEPCRRKLKIWIER